VHFENYIVHDDAVGARFADAFIKKAREGVSVRVIYDWIGCMGTPRAFWNRLRASGVEVRAFNPPRLDEPLGWVTRDHRKCLVVDGDIAFVTGLCVGQMWEGTPEKGRGPWRDTGVEIRGPAVAEVSDAFADSYRAVGGELPPEELPAQEPALERGRCMCGWWRRGREARASIASIPSWRPSPTNPVADRRLLRGTAVYVQALRAAARRWRGRSPSGAGPGSDIPFMQTVSRTGYRALLQAGVRVFEWNGPMLHAKTAVADARWARVGSTNLNLSSWVVKPGTGRRGRRPGLRRGHGGDVRGGPGELRPRSSSSHAHRVTPGGRSAQSPVLLGRGEAPRGPPPGRAAHRQRHRFAALAAQQRAPARSSAC
jgi:cardiolipin synthase